VAVAQLLSKNKYLSPLKFFDLHFGFNKNFQVNRMLVAQQAHCIAKMGADESSVSTFCFSNWLHIQPDDINLAICISSTFVYKFSFS